ncbi:Asp-tRNA(Asn)/Glu-tRNA(Gln) amidotransferase subunit GatB [Gammaproteobacteria bacterium]|nr:Asp-tRNA(Asn)/Glu-tRNA(Gln) amidotransferase subunit GatB [Gammaproteobacteria bacterium]MDA7857592.1 Asp-tRNA(Asn)/Glu-tRNA(Gln) amidotransferase subunit GatB [Gammaproteobacteria bacterium]MDA8683284.1 Asp-tRNA(Asn)/Glu-tRNA(Gln) amidotransferase subunit GatB [Gammaproteobacteria bacterium]MDB0023564.1 Asp-tRNA(Asn)/Glu-tRNA(Gln) amidotransferase subunit GatB [Gammaproteobacteria bacterium]MDC1443986.1 Asp-tRNA(Asn)/Glu-tRNA(Gln) amidotransferase subunit GatB [Gammaproteobacteria bacterium
MNWETVIGLEIHVQLSTNSKLFSGGSTGFGAEPNTHVDLIDMGLPGVLPVANREAFYKAIRFGLATNAEINQTSSFDRKNYFYPDLPKGYQITQMAMPIVGKGSIKIDVDGSEKVINITRAHLEEDAGKSIHDLFDGETGVDLNRAGTPLLEIVSEPEISNAKEAVAYFKAVRQLVTFLDICDGNMAQGSMRCDVNVSIKKEADEELGTRAEIKNINSFKFIERAINFEIERQIRIIESGKSVVQETRLYDSVKNETRSMRSKEEANDYRYFPCPDLLPVVISDDEFNDIKNNLPELPDEKEKRYILEANLEEAEAKIISSSKTMANMFEEACSKTNDSKLVANWLVGDVSALLNSDNIDIEESKLSSNNFAILIERISDKTISGKIAKSILEEVWESGDDVDNIIKDKGLVQIQDESVLEEIAQKIINNNLSQVEAYKGGKDKLFGFFVGQVMKETQGKANPKSVNDILKNLLNS